MPMLDRYVFIFIVACVAAMMFAGAAYMLAGFLNWLTHGQLGFFAVMIAIGVSFGALSVVNDLLKDE